MRRGAVETDFEISITENFVEVHFAPTRSLYTFTRLTADRDVAEFGPLSPIRSFSTPRALVAPATTMQRMCWKPQLSGCSGAASNLQAPNASAAAELLLR
jgi:hypothetical protein